MLLMGSYMDRLSINEINNIVYLSLKYAFGIDNPNNNDIVSIIQKIQIDSKDHMIKKIVSYVKEKYGPGLTGTDTFGAERHMDFIIDEFLKLPYETRVDLGEDREAEEFEDLEDEFVVKH